MDVGRYNRELGDIVTRLRQSCPQVRWLPVSPGSPVELATDYLVEIQVTVENRVFSAGIIPIPIRYYQEEPELLEEQVAPKIADFADRIGQYIRTGFWPDGA